MAIQALGGKATVTNPKAVTSLQSPIAWRDVFLRDWGLDLPILSGEGRKDAPYRLAVATREEASRVELQVLWCVGCGLNRFWRVLGRRPRGPEFPGVEVLEVETIQLTETEIITENHSFHFEIGALVDEQDSPLAPPAFVDCSGVTCPMQLGFLHFEKLTDNELTVPGLGTSLTYRAPGVTVTLFVYGKKLRVPEGVANDAAFAEFRAATRDVETMVKGCTPFADTPFDGRALQKVWSVEEGRGATLLWLTATSGKFVKARVTWQREPLVDRVVREFVGALYEFAPARIEAPVDAPVLKNARRVNGRLEILNFVSIALPGPWTWYTEDNDQPGAKGVVCRACEPLGDREQGYVGVWDVSGDPTEPNIDEFDQAKARAFDAELERLVEEDCEQKGMRLVRWMSSSLNEDTSTKAFVTIYTAVDQGRERQFYFARMTVAGRKVVLHCCVDVERMDELNVAVLNVLRGAAFLRATH